MARHVGLFSKPRLYIAKQPIITLSINFTNLLSPCKQFLIVYFKRICENVSKHNLFAPWLIIFKEYLRVGDFNRIFVVMGCFSKNICRNGTWTSYCLWEKQIKGNYLRFLKMFGNDVSYEELFSSVLFSVFQYFGNH